MASESQNLPVVSVIMPVRNEGKAIRHSLGSVLTQDYPADRLEVLVADGMSDDDTRAVVSEILLFPTIGQVTYVLLTRPPLSHRSETVRLACIKHAASVCPEPGSNSPN